MKLEFGSLRLLYAVAGFVLFVAIGRADSVILQDGLNSYQGTQDATIFEDYTSNSAGAYPYVFAGVTQSGHPRRTLIKFDLDSEIPITATITSASLDLYTNFGRPGNFSATIHKMTQSWNEGGNILLSEDQGTVGQGKLAQTGDSTWGFRSYNTENWTTAGGDFSLSASATGTAGAVNTWLKLTGTGIVQDIQSWITAPAENHGWALLVQESVSWNAKRYYSSEQTTEPTLRPRLVIEFENSSLVHDWTLY